MTTEQNPHDFSEQIEFFPPFWHRYFTTPEAVEKKTAEVKAMYQEELKYLEDYYRTALTQKPKMTILYHYDGTDEVLSQMFIQTNLPDSKFTRFYLKMKARFAEFEAVRYSYTLKEVLAMNRLDFRNFVIDLFRQFDMMCVYAFANLTECEAEIQANIEAHSYYYDKHAPVPYYNETEYIPVRFFDTFDYPPIKEEDYRA